MPAITTFGRGAALSGKQEAAVSSSAASGTFAAIYGVLTLSYTVAYQCLLPLTDHIHKEPLVGMDPESWRCQWVRPIPSRAPSSSEADGQHVMNTATYPTGELRGNSAVK